MDAENSSGVKKWHIIAIVAGILLLKDLLSREPKPVAAAVTNPCKAGQ